MNNTRLFCGTLQFQAFCYGQGILADLILRFFLRRPGSGK